MFQQSNCRIGLLNVRTFVEPNWRIYAATEDEKQKTKCTMYKLHEGILFLCVKTRKTSHYND